MHHLDEGEIMRFLVVTNQRQAAPPEMMLPLVQAMKEWLAEHRTSGKLVEVWNFAGIAGGGGIVEVDSHEELEVIMGAFPLGPFSDIEAYALSDVDAAMDLIEANVAKLMAPIG
jgi:muconolactone delta-isomerase